MTSMLKNHIFGETTDSTLIKNLQILGFTGASQFLFSSTLRIEAPRAIVDWCEVEGYDSYQLAQNVGHQHYDLTLMPI